MPWKSSTPVDLRVEFMNRVMRGEAVAQLCREYGISRKTGDKFKQRFLHLGQVGLVDQSRAPKVIPHRTPPELVFRSPRAGWQTSRGFQPTGYDLASSSSAFVLRTPKKTDSTNVCTERSRPRPRDRPGPTCCSSKNASMHSSRNSIASGLMNHST